MATPRKRYYIGVCRSEDDRLYAVVSRTALTLPYVWCLHHVRATSQERARQKALDAHAAHEAAFLEEIAQRYPKALRLQQILREQGTLQTSEAQARLRAEGIEPSIQTMMGLREEKST